MLKLGHHTDRSASFLVSAALSVTAEELAAALPPSTVRAFLAAAPTLAEFVAHGVAFTVLGPGHCAFTTGRFSFSVPGDYALRIAMAHSLGP